MRSGLIRQDRVPSNTRWNSITSGTTLRSLASQETPGPETKIPCVTLSFGSRCESRTRRINDLSWTTRADNNLQGWRAGLTRLCQSRTRFEYRLSRFAVARGFSCERERQGKRGGSLPREERLFIRREGKIRDKLTPSFLRPRQIRLTRHCVSVIDRKSRDSTESYRKFHEQEKRCEIGEIFKELRVAKTFDRTNVAGKKKIICKFHSISRSFASPGSVRSPIFRPRRFIRSDCP